MKGYVQHSMDGGTPYISKTANHFGVYYLETFIRTPCTQNQAKEKDRKKEKGVVGTLNGQKGGHLQATHTQATHTQAIQEKKTKRKELSRFSREYNNLTATSNHWYGP